MPYSVFEQAGGLQVDPPTLIDASIPLELSGEAVRSRLCIFTDSRGREQALRPDLTLPVAKQEAERRTNGGAGEQRYHYNARAYRLPTVAGQPMEFTQIGTEVFGAPATAAADAALFAQVTQAAEAGGMASGQTWLGDLSIFPAFVEALGLADVTAAALKRAFRQAGGVSALLNNQAGHSNGGLAARLAGASREDAEAVVKDVLGVSGIEPVGARSLDEIVDGLLAKAASVSAGGVPSDARKILENVLAVKTSAETATDALSTIAKEAQLSSLDGAIGNLQVRIDESVHAAPTFMKAAKFETPFGRRFNYYDGFVFEVFENGLAQTAPFAAGGRYDSLIEKLSGGTVSATGIGGVVRPDRMGG